MTLTMNRPWSNTPTAHRLFILDICAEVFCKSPMVQKYRVATKYSHTMFNLELWSWLWTDLGQTCARHRLIIFDICAEVFVNPTMGWKDKERTDRQTDRHTYNDAKTNIIISPFHGGDIKRAVSVWYLPAVLH